MQTAHALTEHVSRNNLLREHLELPPLPVAAQRLLAMMDDDEVEIETLAEVIELDPALTARIIGLSRSAFFGDGSRIHSVRDAIVRVLGLNLVRSLALSMSLSGVFSTRRVPSFDLQRYWCTALLTGHLARLLTPYLAACSEIEPDSSYLAGLLHSIGYLPMAGTVSRTRWNRCSVPAPGPRSGPCRSFSASGLAPTTTTQACGSARAGPCRPKRSS